MVRPTPHRPRGRSTETSLAYIVLILVAMCLMTMTLLPMMLLEFSPAHQPVRSDALHTLIHLPTKNTTRLTKDGRAILDLQISDLTPDTGFGAKPVERGVAGRPLEETPSVAQAQRGHIECDINVDSLAYWNTGEPTMASPFAVPDAPEKFITFTPDHGGWNNVRMSLEIIFIIAAATGRTLVLPPPEPLYLMHHDKENKFRAFGDFFPMDKLQHRVKVVSMKDYLQDARSPAIPSDMDASQVREAADNCVHRRKSDNACDHVNGYLKATGTFQNISMKTCLVFDEPAFRTGDLPTDPQVLDHIGEFCGQRPVHYWDKATQHDPETIFFDAGSHDYRLLTHFYDMILFTDPKLHNYMARFVRDYLHYHDVIYCAAGKIVKAVQTEALALDQNPAARIDREGAGAFSALHVRRGDLQYNKVKFPAQEWYDNTQEVWEPNELMYVATDERNKTFFDDFAVHHPLRFLDDYWDLAGLGDLDPNYMGMIDTIVASRARAYAGTWFSTFSGYINRLRGYHGMTMLDSWYSWLPRKRKMHDWEVVDTNVYAFEFPDGWIGIDADVYPSRDRF